MITADSSRRATDARLRQLEGELTEIYTRAYDTLRVRWDDYLLPLNDEIEKYRLDMVGETDKDKKEKARKKYAQALKDKTVLDQRFRDVAANLTENLANVNKIALSYINGELPEVYSLNYNDMGTLIVADANTFHTGFSFDLVDADTVRILATQNPELLPYKELDAAKDIRWNTKKINSEVLQGILIGEPVPDIAARLRDVVGMNERSAIVNARTMVTSAENRGRLESMRRSSDDGIVLKKCWMSSDQPGRTRDWHMPSAFESTEVDVDEPFHNELGEIMYPGDPTAKAANVYNCRCSMGTVVVGFRDLDTGKITYVKR